MLEWRIGDVSITAVVELEPVMPATSLFAMATEDQVAAEEVMRVQISPGARCNPKASPYQRV